MKPNIGLQLITLSSALLLLGHSSIIIVEDAKACFRRALAGKRISHRWVRRTLACERVEDCQIECGHEKRFTCEGFNYKLDPSGRGQGVCELIDVPLSEMDLYSSQHNRDENLLYHPDYDYYERDRNTCRPSPCVDCVEKPYGPPSAGPNQFRPTTYRPESGYHKPAYPDPPSHYRPSSPHDTVIDKYRPPTYESVRPPPTDYDRPSGYDRPSTYDRPSAFDRPSVYDRPSGYDRPSAFDRPTGYDRPSGYDRPTSSFDNKPPDYDRYDISGPPSAGAFRPPSAPTYGSEIDRYDSFKPIEISRPGYQEVVLTSAHHGYDMPKDYHSNPFKNRYSRPDYIPIEDYRPSEVANYRPSSSVESSYLGPYRPPEYESSYRPSGSRPDHYPSSHSGGGPSIYLDRDPPPKSPLSSHRPSAAADYRKPSSSFIPYSIGDEDKSWGSYGGSYGGSTYSKYSSNYWGLQDEIKRKDEPRFNYFELGDPNGRGYGGGGGGQHGENSIWNYPGSRYDAPDGDRNTFKDKAHYASLGNLWTRRPGQDECSAKSSEGFRLHKGVVRYAYKAPTVTECERMCHAENKFRCVTYSYRYSSMSRDNCLLCDRPVNLLDYYADIEPDRDYDIYAMSDDPIMCSKPPPIDRQNNAQCFFQAIDASRFFKSIVRDSLTVRSVGECEMECIKSSKFTCRAFSFRYGLKTPDSVIDNCQLSDWPVRDMDKDRHLVHDVSFDVFERASYGHGCEIQPITDDKHKKLCYLGYGSPAKLLSSAIKKVISVPTELECKKECIRFRDTTPFKCYSFSFGSSQASSFNCEMSDLDQSELKLNIHYAHTNDRDYWLFAWNPFDWTCRDKVTTIGGGGPAGVGGTISGNRVNNDRRMDIFREPGGNAWTHFAVSGRACRLGSGCEKNLITGFHSCELDGGEIGSWDYCCKSSHPCGYSQGFDYPWCYVGDLPDQWRTCSDRYYPKNKMKRPGVSSLAALTTYSGLNKKKVTNSYHQPPPRPGGLEDIAAARLWPVTYLYSSGPPNSTELISNIVDCNKESC